MKIILALSALLAVALAQGNFDGLVNNEVDVIIAANPGISVGECSAKCDAMFDLADNHDEHTTDSLCLHSCECKINNNCHNHNVHHTTPHHGNNNHHHG